MKEHLRERRLLRKLRAPWEEIKAAELEELSRLTGLPEKQVQNLREGLTYAALRETAEAQAAGGETLLSLLLKSRPKP